MVLHLSYTFFLLIALTVATEAEEIRWTINAPDYYVGNSSVVHKRTRFRRSSRVIRRFTMTRNIKSAFIRAHNDARRNSNPSASNMIAMTWDNELERLAQRYSQSCVWQHNPNRRHSKFSNVGENLHICTGCSTFNPDYFAGTIRSYVDEVRDYNYNRNRCNPGRVCGHYTQVVWAGSYKVGCGASQCDRVNVYGRVRRNAVITVCNYAPAGNWIGRKPYKSGRRCSACPTDFKYCVNNLCSSSRVKPNNWGPWSSWSKCTKSCGGGNRRRTRTCRRSGRCTGSNIQQQKCNTQTCRRTGRNWGPWRSWTSCSKPCGGGIHQRTRVCRSRRCAGSSIHRRNCNTQTCSGWANWQAWSKCSRTCAGGVRTRTRRCRKTPCPGSSKGQERCNTQACQAGKNWGPWKSWSRCSSACGGGVRRRARVCRGRRCLGSRTQRRKCNTQTCSGKIWGPWISWSKCSSACGGGTRRRTRMCRGRQCVGKRVRRQPCNTQACSDVTTRRLNMTP